MNTQEVLRLIADQLDAGQDPRDLWEVRLRCCWEYPSTADLIARLAFSGGARLKPKTHMVHGVECPAPMSEEPRINDEYWSISFISKSWVMEHSWNDCAGDRSRFEKGVAFHSKFDALANVKALYPGLFEGDSNE